MKILPAEEIKKATQLSISMLETEMDSLTKQFKEMEEVCEANNGIGLAGNQVGLPYDMFIIKHKDNSFFKEPFGWFVNGVYEPHMKAKRVESTEGCLSIRDDKGNLKFYKLNRYDRVIVRACQINEASDGFKWVDVELNENTQSFVFQHEIDHSSNILISQLGQQVIFN